MDTSVVRQDIKKVFVVCKTHMDVGFTGLAADVVNLYMQRHIPAAIALSKDLEGDPSSHGFVWTTGSWIIWEYLKTGTPKQVKLLEDAIWCREDYKHQPWRNATA